MRILKPLVLALYGLFASIGLAQFPAPQINLSGTTGVQGSPFLNNGTVQFATDANQAMTPAESSGTGGIKITSAVSLTATRSYVIPSIFGKLQFLSIENATPGGQSISVCVGTGTTCGSGAAIAIPNGQTASGVWFDGTNVVGTVSPFSTTTPTYGQIPVYSTSLNQYVPSLATALYADLEPGADECAKVNAAIASLGGNPGLVATGNGQSYPCATTIVKPLNVMLDCNISTIVWNPGTNTGGPLQIYSAGTPTTSQANGGVRNCVFSTPVNSSGIPLTAPNTTTTVGVFLGGDPNGIITPSTSWGAFQTIENTWFYGFNQALEYGSNTWLLHLYHDRFAEGYSGISVAPGSVVNSGEEIVMDGGSAIYNNSGPGFNGNSGYYQQWKIADSSLDYNNPNISGAGFYLDLIADHIESSSDCMVSLSGSYRSTIKMIGGDFFYNASTGTANGFICGASSTDTLTLKGVYANTGGAAVSYSVYTAGAASINLCGDQFWYLQNTTSYTMPLTDAVLSNCGPDSFGASIARIIPTFVAPTGTTAYGLQVTQPTGGTSNNQAINSIGGIQVSNLGGVGGTGDLYVLQGRNYGSGGAYVNLTATINYISEKLIGPTQSWGQGLFGTPTYCLEDLTNLTSGVPTCVVGVQPAAPINSILVGTSAVTLTNNVIVTNAGGLGGTAEEDFTLQNLGSGATYANIKVGSDNYGAYRVYNGTNAWAIGNLGNMDLIFQHFNGSATNNIVDISYSAPANSLNIAGGTGFASFVGGVSAASYSVGYNVVLPVGLLGYTGSISYGDTYVQLGSNLGTPGSIPMYGPYGGISNSILLSNVPGVAALNIATTSYIGSTSTFGLKVNAGTGGTGTNYALDTEGGDVLFNKNVSGSDFNLQEHNYASGAGAYLNITGTSSYYESVKFIGTSQSWGVGMFGATNWCLQDITASHCVINVAAGSPAGALTISSAGALTATSAASAFASSTTIGGVQVCLLTGLNCPPTGGHSDYWSIPSGLFATATMLGPVYYETTALTASQLGARFSGSISCSVAPAIVLMDLGTNASTSYGSATIATTLTTGTTDGVYNNAAPEYTTLAGHFYGVAFSGGTCITAPTIDITLQL